MKKRVFIKSTIILTAIIGTVFIGEILVRIVKPQLTYSQANHYSPNCYASDPNHIMTLKSNAICRQIHYYGDYNTKITTNSLGYRNKEFTLEKKDGTKRILVLGDSMTFGVGVKDDETYPYLLEQLLKQKSQTNIEVINAGFTDGFSPDSYYVHLKKRGLLLKPDLVVLGFFVWNDISDLSETVWKKIDSEGLPEQVESCCRMVDGGVLRSKNVECKYRYPVLRESHLFLLLVNTLSNNFKLFVPAKNQITKRDLEQGCILHPFCVEKFKEEEEKTYKVISAMKKLTEENHMDFLVVLLPVDIQFYPDAWEKYGRTWLPIEGQENFIQKRIAGRLSLENIKYLDLYPVFKKEKDNHPFFRSDAHFNALGHRLVAEEIANYLLENKKF